MKSARFVLSLIALTLSFCAFAVADPIIYGAAYIGATGQASLYTIDASTGAATLIGAIGFERVSAMDFGPNGVLYAVGRLSTASNVAILMTIDTGTGVGTEIGALGLGSNVAQD